MTVSTFHCFLVTNCSRPQWYNHGVLSSSLPYLASCHGQSTAEIRPYRFPYSGPNALSPSFHSSSRCFKV